MQLDTLAGIFALILATIHLFAGKLRFLNDIPRSRWLSVAGGASVAYVFVHILPDLSRQQATIERNGGVGPAFLANHAYLAALLGLAIFYGLERAAKRSRQQSREAGGADQTSPGVFWIHISSFAVYNALIGYLMVHREVPGLRSLVFFFLAMALHFAVNDYGLRRDHQEDYHRIGRWLLAAAVLIGWGIGIELKIQEVIVAVLFAFLAGGVILNVLKEELPEERLSSFWAFSAGALGYTVLLLFG
jgi:predicted membrane protein